MWLSLRASALVFGRGCQQSRVVSVRELVVGGRDGCTGLFDARDNPARPGLRTTVGASVRGLRGFRPAVPRQQQCAGSDSRLGHGFAHPHVGARDVKRFASITLAKAKIS